MVVVIVDILDVGKDHYDDHDDGHEAEEDDGSSVPGELFIVIQNKLREKEDDCGQDCHEHHQVPPWLGEHHSWSSLDSLSWDQHQQTIRDDYETNDYDKKDSKDTVNELWYVPSEHEDETINAGDDEEEEAVNWKNSLKVSDRYVVIDEGMEEHEITSGSNDPIDNMEDGDDECEVSIVHAPPLLPKHCQVWVEPVQRWIILNIQIFCSGSGVGDGFLK